MGACAFSPDLRAAPGVTIRGRSTLLLRSVEVQQRSTTVVVRLLDASLRRAIPRARVRLRLETPNGRGVMASERTDHRGDARFELRTRRRTYQLSLAYAGDHYYASTQLQRLVDLSKATVRINVRFKRALDASRPTQRVELALFANDKPVAGSVLILVNKKIIARVPVPATSLELALNTAALGKPGPLRLQFHFPETPLLNAADAELRSMLVTPVKLSLKTEQSQLPHDKTLTLRGSLRDSQGAIARATVSLQAMGHHVLSAVTGTQGKYRFQLAARDFPPGPLDLRATFSPTVPWRKSAKSPSVEVEVLPPRPLSVRAYAISTLGTFLALLLLLGWRQRHFLLPKRHQAEAEIIATDDTPAAAALEGGLVRGRSRHIRRHELGIAGTVWDPADHQPIAGARVIVFPASCDPIETQSDERGSFTLHPLPAGEHQVEVSSKGYLRERFTITLPHRGRLHGMRVNLIAVRVQLLEVYRTVARLRLPRPALWARWTPRDLLVHLGEPSRSPLAKLSGLLERSYWGTETPDEDVLRDAKRLTSEIDDAHQAFDSHE